MAHGLEERLKEVAEKADREKALKEVVAVTAKEKEEAAAAAKEKVRSSEEARLVMEKKLAETEKKLEEVELKLAEVANLNLTQVDTMANLKTALEAYEDKWYTEGFADAENSVEPVVHEARVHRFGEGWLAAFQAMGALGDSPLWNPE